MIDDVIFILFKLNTHVLKFKHHTIYVLKSFKILVSF